MDTKEKVGIQTIVLIKRIVSKLLLLSKFSETLLS